MEEIMKHIAESLEKAKESGEFTAEQVREIMRETMTEASKSVKGDEERLNKITGGAIIASVEELEKGGDNAIGEMITAAVDGTVDGIKATLQEAVEAVEAELEQVKIRLREEEEKKAAGLRAALKGAGENADAFTGEVKEHIETAVADAKLKNALILGLTRETVKQAVKQAIETGKDVEETVTNITRNATLKALAETHFTSQKVKEVSNIVLSGATAAAEEAGIYIKEVAQGAVKGTREGVTTSAEKTREAISAAGEKVGEFIREDIARTREDLEVVNELFLETVRRLSHRSSEVVGEVFTDLVGRSRKAALDLKEKVDEDPETAAGRIKDTLDKTTEVTGKAVRAVAEETKELGKRSLNVAKGALSGMWKGAKDGLKKGENP